MGSHASAELSLSAELWKSTTVMASARRTMSKLFSRRIEAFSTRRAGVGEALTIALRIRGGKSSRNHTKVACSLKNAVVVEELHPEESAFLVFGGREIAMAAAHDDVLLVWNVRSVKRGL